MISQQKELYSEYLGMRITASMKDRLSRWADTNNLTPAIFTRQLLLGKLDELDGKKASHGRRKKS